MKIFKLWVGLSLMVLVAAAAGAQEWAGKITELEGQVSVVRAGQTLPVKMNSAILPGDDIVTAANSRVKIWFRDQSVITLAEKSSFKVEALEYNPGVSRKSVFNLVSGKAKALVSGWFGKAPEEQYQIKALSTVAGVRGCEFITEVKGQGVDASALFAGVSGTIILWNADHPETKVSLPANFFLEVLNGQMPGMPKEFQEELLQELNHGLLLTNGSRSDRDSLLFELVPPDMPLPGGEGIELPPNLNLNPGNENNNYFNPQDLIFEEPPGFTIITIRVNEGDIK